MPNPNIGTWSSADRVPPDHYQLTARVPGDPSIVTSFDVTAGAHTLVMINFPAWIIY